MLVRDHLVTVAPLNFIFKMECYSVIIQCTETSCSLFLKFSIARIYGCWYGLAICSTLCVFSSIVVHQEC